MKPRRHSRRAAPSEWPAPRGAASGALAVAASVGGCFILVAGGGVACTGGGRPRVVRPHDLSRYELVHAGGDHPVPVAHARSHHYAVFAVLGDRDRREIDLTRLGV